MSATAATASSADNPELWGLLRAIAMGDAPRASRLLAASPRLALDAAAVQALLAHGADPNRRNGSGSTPLHLALHDTGRGGSGSVAAREQQEKIIRLLASRGGATSRTGRR